MWKSILSAAFLSDVYCMSYDLVLTEAAPRQVTCIVRERQLHPYGHVPWLPAENPAHRILSCRDPRGWTMATGRTHASWLRQIECYLKDTGMVGLASAWALARRRPREYRHKVALLRRMPLYLIWPAFVAIWVTFIGLLPLYHNFLYMFIIVRKIIHRNAAKLLRLLGPVFRQWYNQKSCPRIVGELRRTWHNRAKDAST